MVSGIPEAGDLLWIDFTPQSGREQAGRRPAIVLSSSSYNSKTSLLVACPITSRIKGFPFEVLLPETCVTKGAILADHVRSVDWRSRDAEFIEAAPVPVLEEVLAKLSGLLGL